jgi:hypothetical protein
MQSRDHRGLARFNNLLRNVILVLLALILLPACGQAQRRRHRVRHPKKKKASVVKLVVQNPDIFWTKRVEPLLDKQCLKCHAGVRQQGGLDLRSLDTILRGGASGPEIVPGKPADSRILAFITPNAEEHMPPDPKKQLTPEEIAVFKTWIAMMPVPKSPLATGKSTDNTWVADYLADYRLVSADGPVARPSPTLPHL